MIQRFKYTEVDNGIKVELPEMENKSMMFVGITFEEMLRGIRAYNEGEGALIQNAFSFLDADQREFLITGIIQGEWDKMFS